MGNVAHRCTDFVVGMVGRLPTLRLPGSVFGFNPRGDHFATIAKPYRRSPYQQRTAATPSIDIASRAAIAIREIEAGGFDRRDLAGEVGVVCCQRRKLVQPIGGDKGENVEAWAVVGGTR